MFHRVGVNQFSTFAQNSYTYLFTSTPFTAIPSSGPVMQPIGTTTTPVFVTMPASTCPGMPVVKLTHFDVHSGFKAKAFFTGTYSIEMIFKFDQLTGYNRIIDFSNSLSDNGIYTLDDCFNLYPDGDVGLCPGAFDTTNYKQLVITRDNSTGQMNIYLNGTAFVNYHDSTNYYVIGAAPNDSIKFFKDDLDVPDEDWSGNVALIRMCDFVLNPAQINSSYNDFCTRISGIQEVDNTLEFNLYPNPSADNITIETSQKTNIEIQNVEGRTVKTINNVEKATIVDLSELSGGVYFIKAITEKGISVKKFIKE